MEIKTKTTRDDFMNFNKHMLFRSRFKRSFMIASVFTLFWVIVLNYNIPFNLPVILLEIVLFSAVWALLIYLVYQISFNRLKKWPDQNGAVIGIRTYRIQEDGFKEITDSSESLTKWSGIKKIEQTDKYIYVFVDKLAAYIVPKRNFKDRTEMEQFLQELDAKQINEKR